MGDTAGPADYQRLYRETIDPLFGFVYRRCAGDRDLAEDITQETWLRAVKAWHANGIPDTPQAWLTTVARNLLASHFRRRPSEALDENAVAVVGDESFSTERRSLVTRALSTLSISHRRLLHAFHFRREPVADIAARYGVSERAIEGRLRRARQRLRQRIEADPDSNGEIP